MKTRVGRLEGVVTVGADLIENLAHLRFGSMAEELFSVKACEIELLEAESRLPGRDIACVFSAPPGRNSANGSEGSDQPSVSVMH